MAGRPDDTSSKSSNVNKRLSWPNTTTPFVLFSMIFVRSIHWIIIGLFHDENHDLVDGLTPMSRWRYHIIIWYDGLVDDSNEEHFRVICLSVVFFFYFAVAMGGRNGKTKKSARPTSYTMLYSTYTEHMMKCCRSVCNKIMYRNILKKTSNFLLKSLVKQTTNHGGCFFSWNTCGRRWSQVSASPK